MCDHNHHHQEEEKLSFLPLILAMISLILLGLGAFWLTEERLEQWTGSATAALLINLAIFLVAYFLVAFDIWKEAFGHIFKEKEFFDENVLMVLASIGAFALRFYGREHNEFPEAVLVVLLYRIGEFFEDLASDRSRRSIISALDLRKEKVQIETEAGLLESTPEELQIGQIVVLGAGMKVPCDGFVESGDGTVDESSLTGEARPITKEKGNEVYSGTVLKSGLLRIKVSKEYDDSTVAKMLRLVEESASGKGRITRFISKFAAIYTPIVMALAVLVAVVPPLFLGISDSNVWASWIYSALCFLVVSCPCAIVISVPLAYFSGIGLASKQGILVKGAEYFDALNNVSAVCFDKTGTLTYGTLSLTKTQVFDFDEKEAKEYLAACESKSSHPLAMAVKERNYKYEEKELSDYKEIEGNGVQATYRGKRLVCGSPSFLQSEGIACPNPDSVEAVIALAVDNKLVSIFKFSDVLRPSSLVLTKKLQEKGIRTCLFSGDHEEAVKDVAIQTVVTRYESRLLPHEKTEKLKEEKLQNSGSVVYIGDGINDAASLAFADVGIAMGGLGSDAAVVSADVVFMNDDPAQLLTLFDIAKKTKNRAVFNIVVSLLVKVAILTASIVASVMGTWSLPLWASVVGDSGLALLMILSSLLLGKAKLSKH